MTGNDTFYQKRIMQNRKTFITQPKHIISEKNVFFGVAHGDPIFCTSWAEKW